MASEPQEDRRSWPFYRRAAAVISEEGVRGAVARCRRYVDNVSIRFSRKRRSQLYDAPFFDGTSAANTYCKRFAQFLISNLSPKSVLDVGCGDCSFLSSFCVEGIECVGLDGSAAATAYVPAGAIVEQADLEDGFEMGKKFDLVSCIEVAEHLPKRCAKNLVAALTSHSNRAIVFSAAHPGQGGVGHINEQPSQYWVRLFATYGWQANNTLSESARLHLKNSSAPSYLSVNLLIFQRASLPAN